MAKLCEKNMINWTWHCNKTNLWEIARIKIKCAQCFVKYLMLPDSLIPNHKQWESMACLELSKDYCSTGMWRTTRKPSTKSPRTGESLLEHKTTEHVYWLYELPCLVFSYSLYRKLHQFSPCPTNILQTPDNPLYIPTPRGRESEVKPPKIKQMSTALL